MVMRLENFRSIGNISDRVVLTANAPGLETSKLSLANRFGGLTSNDGGSFLLGSAAQQQQNRDVKAEFLAALVKAEGSHFALAAVQKVGLSANWLTNATALTGADVIRVARGAESIRMSCMRDNQSSVARYFSSSRGPSSFAEAFKTFNQAGTHPSEDSHSRVLRESFMQNVKADSAYTTAKMDRQKFDAIANQTFADYYAQKDANFAQTYPGINDLITGNVVQLPSRQTALADLRAMLSGGQGNAFNKAGLTALDQLAESKVLLSRMAYKPDQLSDLARDLAKKVSDIRVTQNHLGVDAVSTAERAITKALHDDLNLQAYRLTTRQAMVTDIACNDPLSEKAVAYDKTLWAQTAFDVVDKACNILRAQPQSAARDARIDALNEAILQKLQATADELAASRGNVRLQEPVKKGVHPASLFKTETSAFLNVELKKAGLSSATVKRLCGEKPLMQARTSALNRYQSWAIFSQKMTLTKDGVSREYESKITPASKISPRFGRLYYSTQSAYPAGPRHQPRGGISSSSKSDPDHARNLKLTELNRLDGQGRSTTLAKVIGHGVLDMWEIKDPTERKTANLRGAHEVLEAAIETNPRMVAFAQDQAKDANAAAPILFHVSVNLITPSRYRELIPKIAPQYQERTFTEAQFEAFKECGSKDNGDIKTFRVSDPDDQNADLPLRVLVKPFAFSFGINPFATGPTGEAFGGWSGTIYEQNFKEMERFIGGLGIERTNSALFGAMHTTSRVQGQPPGGFAGDVFARLQPNNDQHARLARKIQDQTDLIRQLFVGESYQRGNGDPAKMSREILALQGMLEQGLEMTGGLAAATMSRGCKSDKDRGGVLDVELKHKMVTEDLGGKVTPNATLSQEDQQNYNVLAMASGQLRNQQLNVGLPGSKEAGKLTVRIPDPDVRTYLKGLGTFGKE